ncbi:MAG: hypothetical protein HW421_1217 [Ignavibacteria bacterium]|nr:hypothetical protein [Ignavibacteria bacterium]
MTGKVAMTLQLNQEKVAQTPPSVHKPIKEEVSQVPPSVDNLIQEKVAQTPPTVHNPIKEEVSQVPPSVDNLMQEKVAQTPPSVQHENEPKNSMSLNNLIQNKEAQTGASVLPSADNTSSFQPIIDFTFHQRNLPHWQNPGSIYFITFRTYKNLILDDISKQIIYENIIYYGKLFYKLLSFVIMPDHIHIILQPNEIEKNIYVNLSKIMQAIKGYAAKQIIKHLSQQTEQTSQIQEIAQTGASVLLNSNFQIKNENTSQKIAFLFYPFSYLFKIVLILFLLRILYLQSCVL